MSTTSMRVLTSLVAALTVAGCASESATPQLGSESDTEQVAEDSLTRSGARVSVTVADAGTAVSLVQGNELRISLPNPAAGSNWSVSGTVPAGLSFLSQTRGTSLTTFRYAANRAMNRYQRLTFASGAGQHFDISLKVLSAGPNFCGGIANVSCPSDQRCVVTATFADASGTCVPR